MSDQTLIIHPGTGTYFLKEESFELNASTVPGDLWNEFTEASNYGDISSDLLHRLGATTTGHQGENQ
jgi:hypothetical protein